MDQITHDDLENVISIRRIHELALEMPYNPAVAHTIAREVPWIKRQADRGFFDGIPRITKSRAMEFAVQFYMMMRAAGLAPATAGLVIKMIIKKWQIAPEESWDRCILLTHEGRAFFQEEIIGESAEELMPKSEDPTREEEPGEEIH
jgi:hypothetical protein